MEERSEPGRVRLAELVAALSLGVDLGFGQPMEHVVRQCWIALRLAEQIGLDEQERSVVYYTALLTNVGCHTDAHEQAKWFGDDIELKSDKYTYGLHGVRSTVAGLRRLGAGHPVFQRFRIGLSFAMSGIRELDGMVMRHSAMAQSLAAEVGLPDDVQRSVAAAYEQWDGKGWPGDLSGDAIPMPARVAQVAEFVEVSHRSGGISAAIDFARRQSGRQFDPDMVRAFVANAPMILEGLEGASTWDRVLAAEPLLGRTLTDQEFDHALGAIADFVDLKSPYTLGHARAVARLAEGAAVALGIDGAVIVTLRRAALAHGLGRLGVSNAIWDKPGPLGPGEWERVRMQPYLTERMLQQPPALAAIGDLAGDVRERLDGSGYPHGTAGGALTTSARILAVADAYQAMIEPRPHRPGLDITQAAAELRAECRAGRLDGDAADAVLTVAGHPSAGPSGASGRADEPGDRSPSSHDARVVEPTDRCRSRDLTEDGPQPHRAHLRQDRCLEPGRRQHVRDAARSVRTTDGLSTMWQLHGASAP